MDKFLAVPVMSLAARRVIVAACLLFHAIDLGGFTRTFVQTVPWADIVSPPPFADLLMREAGDKRVVGNDFAVWCQQRYDDAGVFDSIILARPYRAILALAGANPKLNMEDLDASAFPASALKAAGVGFVITDEPRDDLELVAKSGDTILYRMRDPAPRASFFSDTSADFADGGSLLDAYAARPETNRLLLPREGRRSSASWRVGIPNGSGTVIYSRPSSDRIQLESTSDQSGFVHVLESWDPGWAAQVDGLDAPVFPANSFTLAVPIPSGMHAIQLRYHTPGRKLGWIISIVMIALLGALIQSARREKTKGGWG